MTSNTTTPSPMAIVKKYGHPDGGYHQVYFSPSDVSGPDFRETNPLTLENLLPVLEAITLNMGGADFFISMIPEADYSFRNANIPEFIEVPPFSKAFAPIGKLLYENGMQNDCDIEISVWTGRGIAFGESNRPNLKLDVYERIPGKISGQSHRNWIKVPVTLDVNGEYCASIFKWFTGAKHGLISCKCSKELMSACPQMVLVSQ